MRYYIDIRKIPRSVTRTEWKQIWHDKRVLDKKCIVDEEARITMLRLGKLTLKTRLNIINDLVYPPLLLGPYQ